ncbi:hypothetical protein [Pedobacter sp.]|uniref:hypothetical protein n=1 Tax=Pedobacter sp. TaxID=1411316 RepID=UPI0031E3FD51
MNINWQYFPKSDLIPLHLKQIIDVFEQKIQLISSTNYDLNSDEALQAIKSDLTALNYKVETSKKKDGKIKVPVLFGRNGKLEKSFDADAHNEVTKTVIEVEAGRAVSNYQFLKDLFQACVMHDIDYLVIAVRNNYRESKDFEKMVSFFETLYASNRLKLPLKGILAIGY